MLVQSGDSIGVGYPANYAAFDHLGFPAGVAVHNISTNGRYLTDAYAARATEIFPFVDRTLPCTLLIQIGTNDLGANVAAADLYQFTTAFAQSARAAGFYVVIDTILPRREASWTTSKETQRLAYNQLVRANTAGADAISDLAADPLIGDGTDPATSPYYADGLHPTVAGQQRLAQLDANALMPFTTRQARSV